MFVEGRMQYLYDETGRRYLDARTLLSLAVLRRPRGPRALAKGGNSRKSALSGADGRTPRSDSAERRPSVCAHTPRKSLQITPSESTSFGTV